MDVKIITNSSFFDDFMDIVRAFAPYVNYSEEGEEITINICENFIDLCAKNYAKKESFYVENLSKIKQKSEIKRLAKIMLYDYLSTSTNIKLPYGSLTGIRPTKLYHELTRKGENAYDYFLNYLRVSRGACDLIKNICDNQEGVYSICDDEIDFFVNIPICTTRCSYCSFISAEYGKIKKIIPNYVDMLCREIEKSFEIVEKYNYKLRSIYVGGGTPTSLSEKDFARVMTLLKDRNVVEFTVEAGRPDTITREKLDIMRDCGVTRISINPQTFNDKTLKTIGRAHLSEDIYRVYNMAKEYDFIINMDLIAMLPNESLEDFIYSVDECIKLSPDNITVHTLAIKKGSNLKLNSYDNKIEKLPFEMLDYSKKALYNAGYEPYYMYKQKYMSGNLENTGFSKKGKECVYNIDIMEETHNIIASGAGGISKRVFNSENRLERLANPKGIDVYLEREDKIFEEKDEFFKK